MPPAGAPPPMKMWPGSSDPGIPRQRDKDVACPKIALRAMPGSDDPGHRCRDLSLFSREITKNRIGETNRLWLGCAVNLRVFRDEKIRSFLPAAA